MDDGDKGFKSKLYSVSQKVFNNNWVNIFKKDKLKDKNILNKPNNQTYTMVIKTNTNTQEKQQCQT
jgi:hypothetical protein